MITQAHVRPASDASLDEVRRAVTMLVAELTRHLECLTTLPCGPTSFVVLADLNEPVRHAVVRWDQAVFAHTETLPVAVDDAWSEDFID